MQEVTMGIESASEQRRVTRYSVPAQVSFRWRAHGEGNLFGEGRARDISLAGAFVWAPKSPPVDSMVEMEITLPWRDPGSRYVILAWMMVVRVEADPSAKGQSGFATVGGAFSLQEVATIESMAMRGTTVHLGTYLPQERLAQAS